jgi:hypothetical protein
MTTHLESESQQYSSSYKNYKDEKEEETKN